MNDNELAHALLEGLKQLDMNITLLRRTHEVRGIDPLSTYTTNTEDALKVQYATQSLRALRSTTPVTTAASSDLSQTKLDKNANNPS